MKAIHVSNLLRDAAGKVIDVEVELAQLRQVGNPSRDLPGDVVEVEVEPREAFQPRHRRRDAPREPLPLERDVGHLPLLVAGHALKAPPACLPVAGPCGQDPVLRVQGSLQLHESRQLLVPMNQLLAEKIGVEEEEEEEEVEERV